MKIRLGFSTSNSDDFSKGQRGAVNYIINEEARGRRGGLSCRYTTSRDPRLEKCRECSAASDATVLSPTTNSVFVPGWDAAGGLFFGDETKRSSVGEWAPSRKCQCVQVGMHYRFVSSIVNRHRQVSLGLECAC